MDLIRYDRSLNKMSDKKEPITGKVVKVVTNPTLPNRVYYNPENGKYSNCIYNVLDGKDIIKVYNTLFHIPTNIDEVMPIKTKRK